MVRRRRQHRRLNTTVAIIGAVILALLVLVVAVTVSYRGRDPQQCRIDGDAALAAGDYQAALLNYREALGAVQAKPDKVALLFKLAQAYVYTDQWPKVMACWNRVVVEEPSNIKARLALLEAQYVQADSQTRAGWQVGPVWKAVENEADELFGIARLAQSLDRSKRTWQALDVDWQPDTHLQEAPLGLYLHLLRGRAVYEQARIGAVTDPNQSLTQARSDLQAVLQADVTQVDAYWYLAQVIAENAEAQHARGDTAARTRAAQEADALLAQAVDKAPQDPQAHTYLLEARLERLRVHVTQVDQRRQQLEALERDYLKLTESFTQSPIVFTSLARFYWMQAFYAPAQQRPAKVEQAIAMAQRAVDLAPDRVDLRLALGELHFRRAMMTQDAAPLEQAVAVGQAALACPEAQATSGPRTFANKANRLSIQAFLAHCSIEHILMNPETAPLVAMLDQARESVAQVEQLLGSPDDPEVAKWRGMLALAEGHSQRAVRELYAVYEKTKASHTYGRTDPVVSYALARVCLDSDELGKALEFLAAALKSGLGYIRPHAILDYLELLGRLDMWTHVLSSANAYNVDAYEDFFGAEDRSRALRIRALIGMQRWQEAENQLARLDAKACDTLTLRIELLLTRLNKAHSTLAQHRLQEGATVPERVTAEVAALQRDLVERIREELTLYPHRVNAEAVVMALQGLMDAADVTTARQVMTLVRSLSASHAGIGFFERLLAERDPSTVTAERRQELRIEALAALDDTVQRGVEQGCYYQQRHLPDQALAMFFDVLEHASAPSDFQSRARVTRQRQGRLRLAADLALGICLEQQDWDQAERIARRVRAADLDGGQGSLFDARIAQARRHYDEALTKVNDYLKQCPLSSQGYLLRSQINTALDQVEAALADITEAATLHPTNATIAKVHVNNLLARNQTLAERVTEAQRDELVRALERALRLDPTDPELLGLYARRTVDRDPSKAVAIYQALAERYPTLDNALILGDLATHVAGREKDSQRQAVYFKMAGAAYEKAATLDPHNARLLQSYARYYRLTGQDDKAEALLMQGQDDQLLWRHFLGRGEMDKARQVLEQAYQGDPRNEQVLRGLLSVAQQQNRDTDVQRYAQELVAAADSLANRIEQITVLLRLGLVQEANAKLQEAGQRFPNEPKVVLLEGWVALRLGRLDQALAKIDQGLAADRDSAVAWYLRGQVYLLQGQGDRAIEDLRRSKVLEDTPTTRLTLAKAFLQVHRPTEAIVELKQAVTEKNAPPQTRQLLEQLYLDAGKTNELTTFYTQMQRLFPEDVTWLNHAGAFYLQQRRPDQAAELFAQSCTRKRTELAAAAPERWRNDIDFAAACQGYFQALLAEAENGTQTARTQKLTQVQSEVQTYGGTPYEAMTQLYGVQAKLAQGHRAEAINDCRRILSLPDLGGDMGTLVARMVSLVGVSEVQQLCDAMVRAEAYQVAGYLGRFYLASQAGQTEAALEAIAACLQRVQPGEERYWTCRLERAKLLTVAYEKTAEAQYRDQAVTEYQSLLDKWPTNSNVLNNLAYLLAESPGRVSEALGYAEKAWAAAPDHPVVLDTYGYVLFKGGQHERAVELLSAARQQYEQRQTQVPAPVFEHLGQAWEALGDKDKARQAFEQALQAQPGAQTTRAQARIQSAIGRLAGR